jgi:hypothetical protein
MKEVCSWNYKKSNIIINNIEQLSSIFIKSTKQGEIGIPIAFNLGKRDFNISNQMKN